jgi:hypothetical protein
VLHDKLVVDPFINPGDNCVVGYSPAQHVLTNYTDKTHCELKNQDGLLTAFDPIDYNDGDGIPNDVLFQYTISAPLKDQFLTLRCVDISDEGVESAEQLATGVCRLSVRAEEYN